MISSPTRPSCVSFFSGGGGLDLGLECAGFETRFASDIDIYSCASLQRGKIAAYERGFRIMQEAVIISEDIKNLSGSFVSDAARLNKGEIALMAGGPPCQAFSVFGKRNGRKDQRGMLIYEYFRLLSELKPEAFVFENVFGLLSAEGGEVFKNACEMLKQPKKGLKYEISVLRLNAVDYGVPQHRDRIFIIGSRSGKKINEILPITAQTGSLLSQELHEYRTVEDALRDLPPPNLNYPPNHTGRKHSDRIIERYGKMKPRERDHYTRINKLDLKSPSFTIIVGSDKGGGKGHIHPTEAREVTPRESARIQTFPDWWGFNGTVRHPIRQVGNAVPPLLGFAVGNAIRTQIFGLDSIPLEYALETLSQRHLFEELV